MCWVSYKSWKHDLRRRVVRRFSRTNLMSPEWKTVKFLESRGIYEVPYDDHLLEGKGRRGYHWKAVTQSFPVNPTTLIEITSIVRYEGERRTTSFAYRKLYWYFSISRVQLLSLGVVMSGFARKRRSMFSSVWRVISRQSSSSNTFPDDNFLEKNQFQ